jgi:photoactive yellow protein
MKQSFDDANLLDWLDNAEAEDLDNLDFGVVRMNYENIVVDYNDAECKISGYNKINTIGKHFFEQIAPCLNNFMVSEKYKNDVLDETLPYIFTHIMKPTKVILRLIKGELGYQYMLAKLA